MLLVSRFALLISVLGSSLLSANPLTSLNYMTEEYPPYNFSEDGVTKGISVDILIESAAMVGGELTHKNVELQPWARAYRNTLIKPNMVLFSMTRTERRETLFKWVGPISKTRIVVLARKSSGIEIKSSLDLAQFKIGVIRDDVGEQLLISEGIPRDSMQESSYAETLAEQLQKGRIDLWAYEENVAKWWIQGAGYQAKDFEPVYVLQEGELYYAFNTHVEDEVINSLQQGLDKLKSTKNEHDITLYQAILNRYQ